MRISAKLIDDDPSAFDSLSLDDTTELIVERKPKNCNWFFKNCEPKKVSVKVKSACTSTECRNELQPGSGNLQEVTQKFKNLQLSDVAWGNQIDCLKMLATASTSKTMENASGDNTNDLDVPPVWMEKYFAKIKQEIKKEILEEIMQVTQGDVPNAKVGMSNKLEESQFDFQGEVIHTGIFCDNCDQLIHGIRYKCGNCSDFDLCQECESLPNLHSKTHVFLKIRYPVAFKLYQKEKLQGLAPATMGKIYMSSRNRPAKKLYAAKFVRDETVPDSTVLSPSTKFVKTWRVVNSGTRVWTHATKLCLIQGSPDLIASSDHVDVPHLKPGEEGVISVYFTSPPCPGVFRSHWNFCHKSRPFGDIVWCHIIVKALVTEEVHNQNIPSETQTPPEKVVENKQNEVSSIEEVLTAVQKEHDRGNMVPRKLVVTSRTATPNNTPFDITPPKSPDHHETSVKEMHDGLLADNTSPQTKDSDNEDDDCSVVSLESSDSDTEFVVIPMPKCFNLSESFVSEHIPQWFQDPRVNVASEQSPKPMHKTIQLERCPNLMKMGNGQMVIRKFSPPSKTISQETGVPELPLLQVIESRQNCVKRNCISLVTDGSSSEISIIESEDNSPMAENAAQTIESINVCLLTEELPNTGEVDKIELCLENAAVSEVVVVQEEQIQNEEQIADIACSATFPKFPVEGITSIYDPHPASNEERTVQVLPEGLVTGALSAAASVYNMGRAVISTIQQPRNERGVHMSQDIPTRGEESTVDTQSTILNPMDQLLEMGFCNRQQNEELLTKHKGDVALVVGELVNLSDNDWYASRHTPSPQPCFD